MSIDKELEDRFKEASERVHKLPARPGNNILLDLYSLYKQGSQGDVQGKRPGMLDFKGRAKYDAWTAKKGMPRNGAMKEYIELVDRLLNE